MNNRIKQLRKELNLTQQKFAEELSISRNFIALIENGNRIPSDRTITDICRVYKVNESWLRDGIGEMFVTMTRQQEILSVLTRLSSFPPGSTQEILLHALSVYLDKLDAEDWKKVDAFLDDLIASREKENAGD